MLYLTVVALPCSLCHVQDFQMGTSPNHLQMRQVELSLKASEPLGGIPLPLRQDLSCVNSIRNSVWERKHCLSFSLGVDLRVVICIACFVPFVP